MKPSKGKGALSREFQNMFDRLEPLVDFVSADEDELEIVLKIARERLKDEPDNFKAHAIAGQILKHWEQYDEALPHLAKACEQGANDSDIGAYYADTLFHRADYAACVPVLEPIVAAFPSDFHMRFMLGYSLLKSGRDGEAFPHLTEAVKYGQDLMMSYPDEVQDMMEIILTRIAPRAVPSAPQPR